MHKRSLATAVLCGGLRVAAAHSATNCTAAHSALVAFGEAVMTFKPRPATPVHVALPLAAPAAEVVQAVGGAELNVAVALSRVSAAPIASYVSVLPHGPLGDAVRSAAEASGVATENVVVDGSPHSVLGTLHVVDDGSGPRPHYQRHHSAFATVASGDTFDWPSLLSPAKWLHVTGITPLLGPGPAAAWSTALEAAAATDGCDVSLDFNHRPALGSRSAPLRGSLEELWALVQPHARGAGGRLAWGLSLTLSLWGLSSPDTALRTRGRA
ncbi:hypothetical protein EMIHUDRAFT_106404 [Emiliania huxleyi CCMP1516]|uniref:Carbohydrate kinase PfkB domain-containing protein n=2 Tax=Emiliania huxleyi TaxID=2903 RepID=A0A0D3I8T2_EMIH1|nr:hypothetical protein EMIHUDRAFT_106404 [Emiliania huxleyi CCMP1516]EOD07667.1 hypothetical protein EMIHUDRAFT_106404 [Emiliania huxleyi CCMP1516]|eukprot:XP_005760096.1 hypothetical protein EMIHUDRAFT_106404 [Emiliania huxleyi CCMP1516]